MYKRQILFFISVLTAFAGYAQSSPLPKDHPISVTAPHLPSVVRHKGVGKKFFGERFIYNANESQARIKMWMRNYPAELERFRTGMSSYLETTDPAKLSLKEAELYYDLKSQWLMLTQLPEFYHKKEK